jgi:formate dehydrogenase subunit gamma
MSTLQAVSHRNTAADAGELVIRYTMAERINHWLGGVSYVLCLITGLAFWTPYLYWMAYLVGSGPTARFLHPWAGLVFAASMVWMYQMWRGDMRTTDADREWWRNKKYYIENQDEKLPPIGRFNYGQKLFFWVMFYSAILLLLSGLVLWLTEYIAWSLRWLRYLAVVVHVGSALVTIGAFIIHVYMGTAMVRGSFTSIVQGNVSAAWAKAHHRLWYEQITGQRPGK